MVSQALGVRQAELLGFHRFQRGEDTSDLIVTAAEGPQDEHIARRFGQHHPLAPAGANQRTGGKAHYFSPASFAMRPKIPGKRETISSQFCRWWKRTAW